MVCHGSVGVGFENDNTNTNHDKKYDSKMKVNY